MTKWGGRAEAGATARGRVKPERRRRYVLGSYETDILRMWLSVDLMGRGKRRRKDICGRKAGATRSAEMRARSSRLGPRSDRFLQSPSEIPIGPPSGARQLRSRHLHVYAWVGPVLRREEFPIFGSSNETGTMMCRSPLRQATVAKAWIARFATPLGHPPSLPTRCPLCCYQK